MHIVTASSMAQPEIPVLAATGVYSVWNAGPGKGDSAVGIPQAPFEVLTVTQLQERQAEALQQTAAITMLPEDEATRVLRHFSWCAVRIPLSLLVALLVCAPCTAE